MAIGLIDHEPVVGRTDNAVDEVLLQEFITKFNKGTATEWDLLTFRQDGAYSRPSEHLVVQAFIEAKFPNTFDAGKLAAKLEEVRSTDPVAALMLEVIETKDYSKWDQIQNLAAINSQDCGKIELLRKWIALLESIQ